jgi:hypothetical protein
VKLVHTEHELSKQTTALATERADRARENAQRAEVAAAAQDNFRKAEILAFNKAQENDLALKKALAARDAAHRRELADHDELLHNVEAFLAAGGGDVPSTCAADLRAERNRSATLGKLFLEADTAAGEMEDAAERHLEQARGLKRQLELDREVK